MKNFGRVLLMVGFCSGAFAQPVDRTNLPPIGITNVIDFALQAHPQAQIARDTKQIADQAVRSARGDFKPGVSTGYDFSGTENPVSGTLGTAQVGMATFTVSQPLFNLPAIRNYQASKERLQAAVETAEAEQLRVAAQAAVTYIDVLKIRITLDLAAENYEYIGKLIESMKDGDLKDRTNPNDLMVADTAWGSSLTEKYRWKADAEASENNFIRDTHLTASDYFLVMPEVLPIPLTNDDAVALAAANNPRLAAAKANAAAVEKDLAAAKSAYVPKVDVYVTGYNMQRPAGDFAEVRKSGVAAGVRVTVPLFDSKRGPNAATQRLRQSIAASQAVDQSAILMTAIKNLYVQNKQRKIRFVGLCRSVRSGLAAVESMRSQLFTKYTLQDLLVQKQALLKAGVELNHEILAEVVDSFNLQVQMGTLMDNLPEPVDSDKQRPNPHLRGLAAYQGLLAHCEERKFFTLQPEPE